MMHDEQYVRTRLRAEAAAAGGQRALARKIGCNVQLINNILKGHKAPCGKPLEWMRLRKVVLYESY